MPAEPKDQHCFNCGEYLGRYVANWRELQSCGKADCEREARYQESAAQEEGEARGRDDDFSRY